METQGETIIQYGEVTGNDGDVLMVKVIRPDACNHCAAKGACHTMSFGREHFARAKNLCNAQKGDRVEIKIKPSGLLRSAALVYLFPAFMLLVGALAGHQLAVSKSLNTDVTAAISGISLFVISILVIWGLSFKNRNKILPEVTRIVTEIPACNAE